MIRALAKRTKSVSFTKQPDLLDQHEYVVTITDKQNGLKAFVAIHSTALGPAHGGTRMKAYPNEAAALRDALDLSRAMSYKSALAGLPYGGAKGVIMLTDPSQDRTALLTAYAKKLEKMNGLFQTGTDVGLTDDDTRLMAKYSRYILGLPKKDAHGLTTSHAASLGVYYALKAAAKYRYGSDTLTQRRIGVKGIGKLGGGLVELLLADGAHVVIADTDPTKLAPYSGRQHIEIVSPTEIHKQPLDIYAPCALGHEFTPKVIKELRCQVVVGGANNQLPNDKAGDELAKKGILYIPDYIANAGGLIFVCEDLEKDGFRLERVEKRLSTIVQTVETLLARAAHEKLPPHRVADMIGRERIERARYGQ